MFYNTALNKQTDKPYFKGWSLLLRFMVTEMCLPGKEQMGQRTEVILKKFLGL